MIPIRAGDRVTNDMVAHIYDGVRRRTLARSEWTHPAHLVFATGLILDRGIAVAEVEAPALIRAYNVSVGGINDHAQGYHHTMTIFFLRAVDSFLEGCGKAEAGNAATALLASDLTRTDYPLRFYSRELLFSVEARREWRAPDLVAQ